MNWRSVWLLALVRRWRRASTAPTELAVAAEPPSPDTSDVTDAAAWAALLGPSQPIPPLGILLEPATPDRAATLRLMRTLRRACGLEERG